MHRRVNDRDRVVPKLKVDVVVHVCSPSGYDPNIRVSALDRLISELTLFLSKYKCGNGIDLGTSFTCLPSSLA